MSIRHHILTHLVRDGQMTVDELADALGEPRKRLQDNIKAAMNAGLVERVRDDVTGLPAYRITTVGRQRVGAPEQHGAESSVKQEPTENDDDAPPPADPVMLALVAERDQLRADLEAAQRELMNGATSGALKPTMPAPIGYACLIADGARIHTDEAAARAEALQAIHDISAQVHVVAVLDTATLSVSWKRGA